MELVSRLSIYTLFLNFGKQLYEKYSQGEFVDLEKDFNTYFHDIKVTTRCAKQLQLERIKNLLRQMMIQNAVFLISTKGANNYNLSSVWKKIFIEQKTPKTQPIKLTKYEPNLIESQEKFQTNSRVTRSFTRSQFQRQAIRTENVSLNVENKIPLIQESARAGRTISILAFHMSKLLKQGEMTRNTITKKTSFTRQRLTVVLSVYNVIGLIKEEVETETITWNHKQDYTLTDIKEHFNIFFKLKQQKIQHINKLKIIIKKYLKKLNRKYVKNKEPNNFNQKIQDIKMIKEKFQNIQLDCKNLINSNKNRKKFSKKEKNKKKKKKKKIIVTKKKNRSQTINKKQINYAEKIISPIFNNQNQNKITLPLLPIQQNNIIELEGMDYQEKDNNLLPLSKSPFLQPINSEALKNNQVINKLETLKYQNEQQNKEKNFEAQYTKIYKISPQYFKIDPTKLKKNNYILSPLFGFQFSPSINGHNLLSSPLINFSPLLEGEHFNVLSSSFRLDKKTPISENNISNQSMYQEKEINTIFNKIKIPNPNLNQNSIINNVEDNKVIQKKKYKNPNKNIEETVMRKEHRLQKPELKTKPKIIIQQKITNETTPEHQKWIKPGRVFRKDYSTNFSNKKQEQI
ncbi:hypothetical protein M0812_30364 [Anaeramoeba flamelloides]|uniref:Uncharacterized protein n=1 Tax=Anaeramoeba flamelloides TaxID=1746091 RepID=A0AAV7Y8L3_9EUKA|nr:hypothetical protein M0812_30364 [Anaeramoeba flamelloides]